MHKFLAFFVLFSAVPQLAAAEPQKPGIDVKITTNIAGYSPHTGTPGTTVAIQGGPFTKRMKVLFGGDTVPAKISLTEITFRVPDVEGEQAIVVRSLGGDFPVGKFSVITPMSFREFLPKQGPVGTRVEISGRGFTPNLKATLGSLVIAPIDITPIKFAFIVPEGAVDDYIVVTQDGETLRSKRKFHVNIPGPEVVSIAPNQGYPEALVRISGKNFTTQDKVSFGGTSIEVTNRGTDWIEVKVPATAKQSSRFNITNPYGETRTEPFVLQIPPRITKFFPKQGGTGTKVRISGNNFRREDRFFLAGKALEVVSLEPASVDVKIPEGAQNGKFSVERDGLKVVSTDIFKILSSPQVGSFSPTEGGPGTYVTIMGQNLENASVTYGGTYLKVFDNTGTSIRVRVTNADAAFVVRTPGGEFTTQQSFNVITYGAIDSVKPLRGMVGSQITIKGRFLEEIDGVYLSGTSLPIVNRSAKTLVVSIPAGATDSLISWTSHGKRTSSKYAFDVVGPPAIASVSPDSAFAGETILVDGEGFDGNVKVWLGNAPGQIVRRDRSGTKLWIRFAKGTPSTQEYLVVQLSNGNRLQSPQRFTLKALGSNTVHDYRKIPAPTHEATPKVEVHDYRKK